MTGPVLTPWGSSDGLKARKLRPGPGVAREVVERNQLARLYGATVAAVAERGYEGLRIGEVVERAGVSRGTFYRYFTDRDEIFLATLDAILAGAVEALLAGYADAGESASWEERLRHMFGRFMDLVVDQPAAGQLCFVEHYAAGGAAIDHADRAMERLVMIASQSFDRSPERAGMPPLVLAGMLGGIGKVIRTRLLQGREAELPSLASGLWEWVLGYPAPPVPLIEPTGLIEPARGSAAFKPTDARQRVLVAVSSAVSEHGYAGTTVTHIVNAGSMSFTTFYNSYSGKAAAFRDAFETGTLLAREAVGAAYWRAPDWPHGVHAGLGALIEFLGTRPSWARTGLMETLAAGAGGHQMLDTSIAMIAELLEPGEAYAPEVSPLAREAIGGAVFQLLHEQLRRHGAGRLGEILPAATYLALTPYVGAEEAALLANGDGREIARPREQRTL